MDHSKKVLILYASAGHGHEKAARAVEEYCPPPARAVDALDYTSALFGRGYRAGYLFLIKHLPLLWGFFYYLLDNAVLYGVLRPLRRLMNRLSARPLERMLRAEQPEVIVCTHFLSVEVVSHLKRRGFISPLLVAVVTDFLPHNFWIEREVDFFVVACDQTREAFVRRGVASEKIRVLGVPIEKKFTEPLNRGELALKFGLERGVPTVLLTSGGAAVGAIERLARRLMEGEMPVQLLVVCGTNAALFEKLSELFTDRKGLKTFGFVENMHELMEVSDVIIGKAGGLTVSEAIAKARPMIVYAPVPGQETGNARALVQSGAGIVADTFDDILPALRRLLGSKEELNRLKANAGRLARPFAARDVASLIEHGR